METAPVATFVKRGDSWFVKTAPGIPFQRQNHVWVAKRNGSETSVLLGRETNEPGIYGFNEKPDACDACDRETSDLRYMIDGSGIPGFACRDCSFWPEFA